MKYLKGTAAIVGLVAGAGTSIIIDNIVKHTTPEKVGKLSKVAIWVGRIFIGSLAGAVVSSYATTEVISLGEGLSTAYKNFSGADTPTESEPKV